MKTTTEKGMEWNIPSNENQRMQPRLLYPARLSLKMEGDRYKELPRQKKKKERK